MLVSTVDDHNNCIFFTLVTLQDVVKEYNELRSGLQKLIGELEAHYGAEYEAPEGDHFAEMMTDFRDKALSKFEELEVRYTSMDVAYKDAVSFYGENPSEMKPDEFFGIFKTFTSSWEVRLLLFCMKTKQTNKSGNLIFFYYSVL